MAAKIILTDYGNQRILEAIANDTNVPVVAMVYGDGNGQSYTPQASQQTLINQIGRVNTVDKKFDATDDFIYFSSIIPANAPPATIRELGLLDDFDKLLAVGVIPDTEKPGAEDNLEVSLPISLGFKTSTGEVMTVFVDGGDAIASKVWVIQTLQDIKVISSTNFY